jgi:hypothetical protein
LIRVIGLRLPFPKIDHQSLDGRVVFRTSSLIIRDFYGQPSGWFATIMVT